MIDEQELLLRVLRGDMFFIMVHESAGSRIIDRLYKIRCGYVYYSNDKNDTNNWIISQHSKEGVLSMMKGETITLDHRSIKSYSFGGFKETIKKY